MPPIVASPGQPTKAKVEKNVAACLEGIKDVIESQGVVHQILMLDELKVEERPHWDDKSNMIMGVYQEHGTHTSLEYMFKHEVDFLIESIQAGDVYLAVEVWSSFTFSHTAVYHCSYTNRLQWVLLAQL